MRRLTAKPGRPQGWATTTAQSLYAFSKRVSRMILLAIALMLIFDAAGSVLIARRLCKPIEKLSKKKWILRG